MIYKIPSVDLILLPLTNITETKLMLTKVGLTTISQHQEQSQLLIFMEVMVLVALLVVLLMVIQEANLQHRGLALGPMALT